MRLTTKGRFAVTAMLDVALHGGAGPVTLSAIAERQQISLAYLEQLFCKLRRSGLVESVRGPGGGYTLGRPPEGVAVADIIVAVDEPLDATQCRGRENCRDDRRCMTHALWAGLNDCILAYLQSVTLADLVRQQREAPCGRAPPQDATTADLRARPGTFIVLSSPSTPAPHSPAAGAGTERSVAAKHVES